MRRGKSTGGYGVRDAKQGKSTETLSHNHDLELNPSFTMDSLSPRASQTHPAPLLRNGLAFSTSSSNAPCTPRSSRWTHLLHELLKRALDALLRLRARLDEEHVVFTRELQPLFAARLAFLLSSQQSMTSSLQSGRYRNFLDAVRHQICVRYSILDTRVVSLVCILR